MEKTSVVPNFKYNSCGINALLRRITHYLRNSTQGINL